MRQTKFLGQIFVLNRLGGLGLKGAELFLAGGGGAMLVWGEQQAGFLECKVAYCRVLQS